MALTQGHKDNFSTLKKAFDNSDVALMQCTDAKTGESVAVICAMQDDGEGVRMIPFARMFNGNPYEELIPPTLEGATQ